MPWPATARRRWLRGVTTTIPNRWICQGCSARLRRCWHAAEVTAHFPLHFRIGSASMLRQLLASASRQPTLRRTIVRLRHLAKRNEPWMRRHPFDSAYNVETSGAIPPWLLRSGSEADKHSNSYAGCQPSCLRAALASIPDCHDYRFVDLGGGKGRALIIASEFPFSRIVGIELAPDLVPLARRNTKSVASRYAGRPPIEVIQGDATAVPFPEGHLVVFLYHAFGPELV